VLPCQPSKLVIPYQEAKVVWVLMELLGWIGLEYGSHPWITNADVIIVLDCDVPWIPTLCKPTTSAIWHIDVDPMKQQMPLFYISAKSRFKADAETVLKQLNKSIADHLTAYSTAYKSRFEILEKEYQERLASLRELAEPRADGALTSAYVARKLKEVMPKDSVVCLEAVTQTGMWLALHNWCQC